MKTRPLWERWVWCAVPAVLAVLMHIILPHIPRFTEYIFSRGVFRAIAFPLQWLMSAVPFSVTELAVVLGVPSLLVWLTVWIVRLIRRSDRRRVAERGCRFVAWCVSLGLLVYMVMHGANYARLPLGTLLNLPDRSYSVQELYTVACDLAERAGAARESLAEDDNGCVVLSVSQSALLRQADDAYAALRDEYPFLKAAVWRVKSVKLSHWWSYTGITGVYCPWLSEANVNTDVPVSSLAHTAAHEVAHTMGFGKEDECNFLGFLACAAATQPDYVYSGYLQAFLYAANALYDADRALWKEAYTHCSDGILRDLQQRRLYWDAFEGDVMDVSTDFNDAFIKANGVESGVQSYSEAVTLLLRYYDSQGALNDI